MNRPAIILSGEIFLLNYISVLYFALESPTVMKLACLKYVEYG